MRQREGLAFATRRDRDAEERLDSDSARLVVAAQRGDDSAFRALYERYFDPVYGYLRVALKDRHEAEDRTQQVFMKAFEALPHYRARPGTPFRAWLFRIARNEVISFQRKHNVVEVEAPEEIDRRRETHVPPAEGAGLGGISNSDLFFFIERLPEVQRQVIVLRYMIGLTTDEICMILERSRAAVLQAQYRARRFLQERLTAVRARDEVESRHSTAASRQGMLIRLRRMPVLGARRQPVASRRDR